MKSCWVTGINTLTLMKRTVTLLITQCGQYLGFTFCLKGKIQQQNCFLCTCRDFTQKMDKEVEQQYWRYRGQGETSH